MSDEIMTVDITSQHIVINQDRSVAVPSLIKKSIVQRDHNIERLTFDCPRYWYGKDISTLNIYVNYISVSQKAKGDDPGSSLCENAVIDESDQDMMHFDWVITNNISQDVGGLLFLVCAKSVDSDGNEDVHWNSHLCKDLEVQEGLEASDSIAKKYPDVIESILSKLGKQIEFRNSGKAIQYRNAGENLWVDLVQLEDIKGDAAVIVESNFRGSDTTENILTKTGETGDKWYSTDEGVYYMINSFGDWINCGSGENLKKIEDEIGKLNEELQGIRDGADGKTYDNAGEAVRGQVSALKSDLGNVNSAVFNYEDVYEVVPQEQYQLITGYCMSGTDEVNGRFTKLLIEPSNVGKKIAILQVKKGEKYKVSGTSYYGLYNALALVLSDTLWDFDTYTTSSRINIIGDDYSLCGGVTESAWRDFVDYEVTIPDGVSYLYLLGNNPRIVKLQTKKISKIDDIDKRISFLDRKKVYEIESAPQVTVGTVTKQHVFSKENRDAYLWEFSEVGSLTIPEIQVNATENDVVGIWVYCNQEMLTQPNNTDGVFSLYVDDVKIREVLTAYNLHVGWNYIKLDIKDNDIHTVKLDFTMVRGNYKIAIDTIELNYKTRTQVLLSFDMSSSAKGNIYTKRFPLVDSYGFKATFCNPNDTNISDEQLNEMWKKGWDWSTYGGEGTRPDYDTGTVDEWVEYLNTRINACANRGLFNPVSYFSPANRGSVVLEQALKKVGFKIARVACSENYYLDWFDDKNGLYIYTFGVGGTETAENTLAVLDKAIETGTSICIFTHDVEDELSSEMNCTTKVYTAILEGLKERVDKGLCDVVTFREFYQHWCPEGYAELMENRHEKEKQYILNKLSN